MFGKNSASDNSSTTSTNFSSPDSQGNQLGHEQLLNQSPDVSAFVGEGVEFKGVIHYQGIVRIDGQLEGEIHTDGTLIVGQGGVIDAKVEAGIIICHGKIVWDIVARENIQLIAPAVLNGSVKSPSLSMGEGVLFNGTCVMDREEVTRASNKKTVGVDDDRMNKVNAIG